jgi:NTE family protein
VSEADQTVAIVFGGGVGLGAYHGGVFETIARWRQPNWLAGSSIGAVTAAILAGTAPDNRAQMLQKFWHAYPTEWNDARSLAHAQSWISALAARMMGVAGQFHLRTPQPFQPFRSIYDLAPLQKTLKEIIDFDRLNSGDVRVTVAATDIETGDLVLFDTRRGFKIGLDHLLASCGYLPEFAPVEIGGRLLGDGGLSANVPIEAVLVEQCSYLTCFAVDLYARDGRRPNSLETSLARRCDLSFGNQTWRLLDFYRQGLMSRKHSPQAWGKKHIYYLSYRASPDEAGSEKSFDYSFRSVARRWQAGVEDATLALERLAEASCSEVDIVAIRRPSS